MNLLYGTIHVVANEEDCYICSTWNVALPKHLCVYSTIVLVSRLHVRTYVWLYLPILVLLHWSSACVKPSEYMWVITTPSMDHFVYWGSSGCAQSAHTWHHSPMQCHSLWPLVGGWGVGAVHTRNFGVIRSKRDGDLGVPNSRHVMLASISLQGITLSYSNIWL